VWQGTCEDGVPATEYIRADVAARKVAEAVAAERERCAAICRQVANDHYSAWAEVCETRIRKVAP
jgi:hypothetical protein